MKGSIVSAFWQGCNRKLLLGVATCVAVLMYLAAQHLIQLFPVSSPFSAGFFLSCFCRLIQSDEIIPIYVIVAGMPYACVYVDDIKSKFFRYVLIRSSYDHYVSSHYWVGCIYGGISLFLSLLSFYVLLACLLLPFESLGKMEKTDIIDAISLCAVICLNGCFWSALAMTTSTFMESQYVAYASPFIVYYIFIILHERYFTRLLIINPKEWINPSKSWFLGRWGPVVIVVELIIILYYLFSNQVKRRLKSIC